MKFIFHLNFAFFQIITILDKNYIVKGQVRECNICPFRVAITLLHFLF